MQMRPAPTLVLKKGADRWPAPVQLNSKSRYGVTVTSSVRTVSGRSDSCTVSVTVFAPALGKAKVGVGPVASSVLSPLKSQLKVVTLPPAVEMLPGLALKRYVVPAFSAAAPTAAPVALSIVI